MPDAEGESYWTDDRVAELGELWGGGVATAEIARRMGTTKGAVIGKVHRIGLPPRIETPARQPRPLFSFELLPPNGCRFGLGDPGEAEFRFCGEETVIGRPYCKTHCARAYVTAGAKA